MALQVYIIVLYAYVKVLPGVNETFPVGNDAFLIENKTFPGWNEVFTVENETIPIGNKAFGFKKGRNIEKKAHRRKGTEKRCEY